MQHASSGLLSVMASLNNQKQQEVGIEGVIQAGSWVKEDGTVTVVMAHTVAAAAFTDSSGSQIYPTLVGVALETTGYGDQYGPVGGERCILRRSGTHYTATIEHNADDSPGAPSGERWSVHRKPGTLTVNSSWKLTNDGSTPGDGLGGYKVVAGGYGSLLTAGGRGLVANDTAGTTAINGASATTGNAVVRQSDLVAFRTALASALASWATANLQGGSGASGPSLSFTPSGSAETFSN